MENIFDKNKYQAPIDYLISHNIREYDIAKANISILLYKGILNKEQYTYYYNLPKQQREVKIGLMQKYNPKITEALMEGFREAKHLFYRENAIEPNQILSVDRDSVILIDKEAIKTSFYPIEFVVKIKATSFYRIGNKLMYYFYDERNFQENEDLIIKGLGDYGCNIHKGYMIDYLMYLFRLVQIGRYREAISNIKEFCISLNNKTITELQFYREFNNLSKYKMVFKIDQNNIGTDFVDIKDIEYIDPSYNIGFLRELYKIFCSIYLSNL